MIDDEEPYYDCSDEGSYSDENEERRDDEVLESNETSETTKSDTYEDSEDDEDEEEEKPTIEALIKYDQDYDPSREFITKKYKVITNGMERYVEVPVYNGSSAEFFRVETLAKLEDVRLADEDDWDGERKFAELKAVLSGRARTFYDRIVSSDYPTAADKTNENYEELLRAIETRLSDHVYPGDRVHTYIESGIDYLECKMADGSGRVEKPGEVLARMEEIKTLGAHMHHNMGADYMSDADFKKAYWNIFPQAMKSWLENDRAVDPFDRDEPLDVQAIADEMQRYWNKHYAKKDTKKDKKRVADSNEEAAEKSGPQDDHQDTETGGRRHKRRKTKTGEDRRRNDKAGGQEKCPIEGHAKYWHGWGGCFLNPRGNKFDHDSAERFYHRCTHGNSSWYRDVYEAYQASCQEEEANHYDDGPPYHQYNYDYDGRGRHWHGARGY